MSVFLKLSWRDGGDGYNICHMVNFNLKKSHLVTSFHPPTPSCWFFLNYQAIHLHLSLSFWALSPQLLPHWVFLGLLSGSPFLKQNTSVSPGCILAPSSHVNWWGTVDMKQLFPMSNKFFPPCHSHTYPMNFLLLLSHVAINILA